ncbi:MAG: very short patch repair endonuclease [Chloroflexi bacterium]|nr:MAG: very short patch repair endonuclease [Chloroflexota bacterium]
MLANRPGATKPEQRLRAALFARGLRFRKDRRPEPAVRCRADVLFPTERICIFVDGCFWHGCRQHFSLPASNSSWWSEKVQATVDRDVRQRNALKSQGWRVISIWEHELRGAGVEESAYAICARVRESTRRSRGVTSPRATLGAGPLTIYGQSSPSRPLAEWHRDVSPPWPGTEGIK